MDSNPILTWLAAECRSYLLNEKWLITDQLRVAQLWRDRLVLNGCDHLNLHLRTLPMLARQLARPMVASQGGEIVPPSHMQLLVRSALERFIADGKLNYFTAVHSLDSLARLMSHSFEELQLAGVTSSQIEEGGMESPDKASDWRLILNSLRETLHERKWFDYAGCLQLASQGLQSGTLPLPKDLRILLPEELQLTRLEREFIESLADRVAIARCTSSPSGNSCNETSISIDGFMALGQINEIRGLFQQALTVKNASLDEIEVLATDYQAYAPLIYDSFCKWQQTMQGNTWNDAQDQLLLSAQGDNPQALEGRSGADQEMPVTFAEGIACVYSRPGRLLRSWMRWAANDAMQSNLVVILREGLLKRPTSSESMGYARLASALRRVPIGFGIDRYLPQIDKELARLRSEQVEHRRRQARDEGSDAATLDRDFGIPVLEAVRDLLQELWPLVPSGNRSAMDMLHSALKLLRNHARAESKLDRYALARLCEEIQGMIVTWQRFPDLNIDVCAWLENLPATSRILASSPRPGAVHVAPLAQGGASGRRHSFIVGMDESRLPKPCRVDPLLLDAERERISSDLATSQSRASRENAIVEQILDRKRGQSNASLTLSFSTRQLHDDRECFPSPVMVELLKQQNRDIKALNEVAFVSRHAPDQLDTLESELARLLTTESIDVRKQFASEQSQLLRNRRTANDTMHRQELSSFDGFVPDAGQRWTERLQTEHVSPSRLECMGSCPRKFFFRHTLGIAPPDECEIDATRWLSPLVVGNLVHELFEQFLRELTRQHLIPDPARDGQRLQLMLKEKLAALTEEVPVPNIDAYQQQCDELSEFCEIFLAKEAEYCEARGARPWVLEASLGAHGVEPREATLRTPLDCETPIPLELGDGSRLRLAGRMDRVDHLLVSGSERYVIWDYKSGSDRDFDASDPLVQGRKLQPFLYLHMLRHRLIEQGQSDDCVQAFGYFFPSPRTEGRRLEWTALQLSPGQEIVEQLVQMMKQGVFIATNNAEDCKYCEYASVCGEPLKTVALTTLKMQHADNDQLEAWRRLRHG